MTRPNVFLYGRGARERSEFYWLKASYFTLKFHPHYLITLVTSHDRSPFKKLVPRTRIELVMAGYQPTVIPFNYPGILAESRGVEPHPISENPVFKAGRRTNPAALLSMFGVAGEI